MKVTHENLQLLHSALTHFTEKPVADLSRFPDGTIMFQTADGFIGFVEHNFVGNYDIWIGEEVVYEMEKDLYDLIEFNRQLEGGLIEFYKYAKTVDYYGFQPKSKLFYDIIISSTENIILNFDIPIVGDALIGPYEIHYSKEKKIKIILN